MDETPDLPTGNDTALLDAPSGDIPDPAIPMAEIATQAQARIDAPSVNPSTVEGQALMSVDEALYKFSQHAASCLNAIDASWNAALRVLNHNNSAIMALKEALQSWAPHTPYAVGIDAMSPSGYSMVFRIEALTQADFLEKVGNMMEFLRASGFQAGRTL
jgi:hypothetical protein